MGLGVKFASAFEHSASALPFSLHHWQRESHRQTAERSYCELQLAAIFAHRVRNDGKAEAVAGRAFIHAPAALDAGGDLLLRQARAVIGDFN